MLPVYARKVANGRSFDVLIYRDAAMTDLFACFDWWRSDRPDRRNRSVMLNCSRRRLIWQA